MNLEWILFGVKPFTGWHKETGTFETTSAHLPNYHCFCKTFLWRKHAVDRSIDPWLLNGKVVCSSRSLFRSAANCTWLPLRISKVPVLLCRTLHLTARYSILSILRDTDNIPASDSCIKQITGKNDLHFHMGAYDICTNLGKNSCLIVLPSMAEAENFSDHPHTFLFDAAVYLKL
jgi:hypothetical protein